MSIRISGVLEVQLGRRAVCLLGVWQNRIRLLQYLIPLALLSSLPHWQIPLEQPGPSQRRYIKVLDITHPEGKEQERDL